MNIVSLFGGMGFCQMALGTLGVPVDKFYSSEIDKYANQATQAMFPDTIQVGDILNWREWDIDWGSIDLVTGGFPCQAWSMAGKQLGDKDERGMLFWTMLDIIKHVKHFNPNVQFLIENVKMKKEFEQYITTHTENALGKVYKVLINSALVSAQNRNRYYWTSFEVGQPEDKGIVLKDIIEHECNEVNSDGWHKWWNEKKDFQLKKKYSAICNDGSTDKAICMTARQYASWNGNFIIMSVNDNDRVKAISENERGYRPHKNDASKSGIRELGRILKDGAEKTDTVTTSHMPKLAVNDDIQNLQYRKLTPRECFRLQTVPEHHINTLLNAGISNTQLYKMCGNGWTHDAIVHIFKGLPQCQ